MYLNVKVKKTLNGTNLTQITDIGLLELKIKT
jgi:hypothetical protein